MWYSLEKTWKSNDELVEIFREYSNGDTKLEIIFRFCLSNRKLFPRKNIGGVDRERRYISNWCSSYLNFKSQSTRPWHSDNGEMDPALAKFLEGYGNMDTETTLRSWYYHNLWMSAENIQGGLLEEYIASRIESLGWVWCRGSIVRAVDFINEDCSVLLQVKNKYNTENSSSSAIRIGTPIKKWFRIPRQTRFGDDDRMNWDELNQLVWQGGNRCAYPAMSEKDYEQFLVEVYRRGL